MIVQQQTKNRNGKSREINWARRALAFSSIQTCADSTIYCNHCISIGDPRVDGEAPSNSWEGFITHDPLASICIHYKRDTNPTTFKTAAAIFLFSCCSCGTWGLSCYWKEGICEGMDDLDVRSYRLHVICIKMLCGMTFFGGPMPQPWSKIVSPHLHHNDKLKIGVPVT